jgi:hypothetical protein
MSGLMGCLRKPPTAVGHRYVRLLATDVSWTNYLSSNPYFQTLWQISFFASTDGTGTDLCIGKTASAKSFYAAGYEASKANDNNINTRFATAQGAEGLVAQWWMIDAGVGNTIDVRSVKLAGFYLAGTGYLYAKSFALQWSDDGTNWTTKATFNTTQQPDKTVQTFQNL